MLDIAGTAAASKLHPQDQKDLAQAVENAGQKVKIQSNIHDLNERCFMTCVANGNGTKLSGKEEGCMRNCVERFMDSNVVVFKHLEKLRG